jgi:glycosyltransferase involved in cell wall biosynthesis
MLPLYGPGLPARLNAWFIRQQVRLVGRVIGVGRQPLVGLTIPTAWPVVRRMKRSALVYNRSDLHSAFPEADGAWVASLEDALMREADRVLYVSHELMRVDADVVGDRAVFLDHGVDLEHFVPRVNEAEPEEMRGIPRPRIGFFGGLDDYVVDLELLAETARGIPEAQLVLIGDATCSMGDLVALPNVHWLGHQPYERIPAFGRAFDVALMPWLDNDWIRFANPIKLKEYLALGLPVVTTDYPEVRYGDGQVAVAASHEDFLRLVKSALSDHGDPQARRSSVLSASWRERARALTTAAESARGI